MNLQQIEVQGTLIDGSIHTSLLSFGQPRLKIWLVEGRIDHGDCVTSTWSGHLCTFTPDGYLTYRSKEKFQEETHIPLIQIYLTRVGDELPDSFRGLLCRIG